MNVPYPVRIEITADSDVDLGSDESTLEPNDSAEDLLARIKRENSRKGTFMEEWGLLDDSDIRIKITVTQRDEDGKTTVTEATW